MGSPAASAEVQPAGRTVSVFKLKIAPITGCPTTVGKGVSVPKLIQYPVVAINHDHMPVSRRVRAAFNRRVCGNRIRPRIALIRIHETDLYLRLSSRYDRVRNTERASVVVCAEIRMQSGVETDRSDQTRAVGIDRRGIDRRIPGVGARKYLFAVHARHWPKARRPGRTGGAAGRGCPGCRCVGCCTGTTAAAATSNRNSANRQYPIKLHSG